MKRTQLLFFATREDLAPVISAIESARSLKYVRAGLQPLAVSEVYGSALELPSFGFAVTGDAVHEPAYLVMDATEEARVETIPQRRGGELYGLYPKLNPRSVTFSSGGRFDDRHIIKGEVSSAALTPEAVQIWELFEREMKRVFRKVKGYWIGGSALDEMRAGVRLTHSVGSPPAHDLRT